MTKSGLPKTQAMTLAELERIESAGEGAYEYGTRNPRIHLAAIRALARKGLVRYVKVTVGTGEDARDADYVVTAG